MVVAIGKAWTGVVIAAISSRVVVIFVRAIINCGKCNLGMKQLWQVQPWDEECREMGVARAASGRRLMEHEGLSVSNVNSRGYESSVEGGGLVSNVESRGFVSNIEKRRLRGQCRKAAMAGVFLGVAEAKPLVGSRIKEHGGGRAEGVR